MVERQYTQMVHSGAQECARGMHVYPGVNSGIYGETAVAQRVNSGEITNLW